MSLFLVFSSLALLGLAQAGPLGTAPAERRNVIVVSDAGAMMDDSWAIAYILAEPSVNVKLVVSTSLATTGKALFLRRTLDEMGRPEVPVAVGAATSPPTPYTSWKKCCNGTCTEVGCEAGFFVGPLLPWAQPIGSAQELLPDCLEAMADVIRRSGDQGVDVLSIGPFTDLAALAVRHPELAARCRIFAMAGSVDIGYDGDYGSRGPDAEYNVITDIPAAQVVFSFKWASFALAPVDTTRALQLRGPPYAKVRRAAARLAPGASVVLEQYGIWLHTCHRTAGMHWCSANGQYDAAHNASSMIYDAQAAFMLVMGGQRELEIEELRLTVNASGFTVRASEGLPVNVSLKWRHRGEGTFYRRLASGLSWHRPESIV